MCVRTRQRYGMVEDSVCVCVRFGRLGARVPREPSGRSSEALKEGWTPCVRGIIRGPCGWCAVRERRWAGGVGEAAHGELVARVMKWDVGVGVSVGSGLLWCRLWIRIGCSFSLCPSLRFLLPCLCGRSPGPLLSLAAHFSLVFQPQLLLRTPTCGPCSWLLPLLHLLFPAGLVALSTQFFSLGFKSRLLHV